MPDYSGFCQPQTLKRQTWYSDTYSGNVAIGNEPPRLMDIVRFQIPFSQEREAIAQRMFNIPDERLPEFYDWFWTLIRNHVNKNRKVTAGESDSFLRLYSAPSPVEENGGKAIYLFTEPSRPALPEILGGVTTLNTVVLLSIRMAAILRDLNNTFHIHHRGITADSFFLGDDGKLRLWNFFFSHDFSSKEALIPYTFIKPQSVALWPGAEESEEPKQDLNAICSLIWNIVSERYVGETPYFRVVPDKVPREFLDILVGGMSPDTASLELFRKSVGGYKKELKNSAEGELQYRCFPSPSYVVQAHPPQFKPVTAADIEKIIQNFST